MAFGDPILSDIQRAISEGLDGIYDAAEVIRASIVARTRAGIGVDGGAFRTYSDKYGAWKKTIPNLYLSGQMLDHGLSVLEGGQRINVRGRGSRLIGASGRFETTRRVELGFTDEELKKRAIYNQTGTDRGAKARPFMGLSPEDIDRSLEICRRRLDQSLNLVNVPGKEVIELRVF